MNAPLPVLPRHAELPRAGHHVPLTLAPAGRHDEGEAVSSGALLAALWQGRLLIFACAVALAITVYLGAKQLPDRFTATGLVSLQPESAAIPELQGALPGDNVADPMVWMRGEVHLLRSPHLIERVINELDLDAHPDFALAAGRGGVRERLVDLARDRIGLDLPRPLPLSPAAERQALTESVGRSLSVTHDNRSMVVDVSFSASDPELAAVVVNEVVRQYALTRAEARAEANRHANLQIAHLLDETRHTLDGIERRIRDTRVAGNLVLLRAGNADQQRLEDMSTALTRARVERSQADAALRQSLITREGAPSDLADALESATIARLREREAAAAGRIADLSQRLGPAHPERRSLEAELAAIRGQIGEEVWRISGSLRAQAAAARDRETVLVAQVEEARARAALVADTQAEITRLEHHASVHRSRYQALLTQSERTASGPRTVEAAGTGVRFISPATTPGMPSGPRPSITAGLGLVAGLAIGCCVALFRARGSRRMVDAREALEGVGVPTLVTIPRHRRRARQPAHLALCVTRNPSGPEAAALRLMRGRLRYARDLGAARSVLIVPGGRGVGAAAGVAAALARIAALDGERVLLVEGCLQRPSLAQILGHAGSGRVGGGTFQVGTEPWRSNVEPDDAVAGLDLLLATQERRAADAAHVRQDLSNMIEQMSRVYDLVVVSAPHVAEAAGALDLANMTDVTVLLVEAAVTPFQQAHEAAAHLIGPARHLAVALLADGA